jgi:hypothetical protein
LLIAFSAMQGMIGRDMNTRGGQSRAVLARDAALERIGRTRRWVIAGAAALTAGIAALVSAVAPGRTLNSKPVARTEASTAPATQNATADAIPKMPAPAGADQLGLQGPSQAPQPVPDQSQPQSDAAPSPSTPSQSQPAPAPQSSGPVVSGGS